MMHHLSVHLIQSSLHWEDIDRNIDMFSERIRTIASAPDVIILPETFTTGFTQQPHEVAEPMEGKTMQWMQQIAADKQCVFTGSIVICEKENYYNRLIWMPPDGNYRWYDKKHLFTYAGEDKHYTAGNSILIVELKGWKIMPLICYDLRFPVWSRNRHDPQRGFAYDCMLNVANWPGSRSHVWRILLMARALENQSYVIGLNRIGEDNNNILYTGDSAVISPKGENLSNIMPSKEQDETVVMPRCALDSFRDKFRAWADWDRFRLE